MYGVAYGQTTCMVLHMSVCVVLHMSMCVVLHMSMCVVLHMSVCAVLPEVLSVELAVGEQFLTILEPPAQSTLKAPHLIILDNNLSHSATRRETQPTTSCRSITHLTQLVAAGIVSSYPINQVGS